MEVQVKMTNSFIDLEIIHFEMLKNDKLLMLLEKSHKYVEMLTY